MEVEPISYPSDRDPVNTDAETLMQTLCVWKCGCATRAVCVGFPFHFMYG